jgi:hypothetical protein
MLTAPTPHRSVRLSINVPLTAPRSAVSTIPGLEGRQLRVAVRADEPEVLTTIVRRITVDVVKDKCQGNAHPHAERLTDGTSPALLGHHVESNVVSSVPGDPSGLAGLEPFIDLALSVLVALACVAAIDLLMSLR